MLVETGDEAAVTDEEPTITDAKEDNTYCVLELGTTTGPIPLMDTELLREAVLLEDEAIDAIIEDADRDTEDMLEGDAEAADAADDN
jgi:hypothetical protein